MTKTQFDASGHIRGMNASGRSLIRATLGAAVAAGVILTVFWLPAEYGIDPTGLGRTMGLTKMGEIKQGLYAEAEAEKTKPVTDPQILNRLDAIEAQLAALVANGSVAVTKEAAPAEASEWRDTWSFTLEPEDSIEAKLKMTEGQQATFEWTANGGLLNYDMHGDGGGEISYEQGRNQPGQSGVLTAAFDGNHGWYWRNRTDQDVTFTLHVRGDYERLLTP